MTQAIQIHKAPEIPNPAASTGPKGMVLTVATVRLSAARKKQPPKVANQIDAKTVEAQAATRAIKKMPNQHQVQLRRSRTVKPLRPAVSATEAFGLLAIACLENLSGLAGSHPSTYLALLTSRVTK